MRPYVNKKKLGKTIRKFVFCTSQAELMMSVNSGFKDAQLSCVFEKKKESLYLLETILLSSCPSIFLL